VPPIEYPESYAYLLGMYLGDGCLVRHPRTWRLVVTLDLAYPGIIERCRSAFEAVAPEATIRVRERPTYGCAVVESYGRFWLALFPHAGAGPKHKRYIGLQPWQRELVQAWPWAFLRGLLESDGCRSINRVRTVLPSGREALYEYPRWYFVNASEDILGLFAWACELVGVRCTRSRPRLLTVSRRDSVALLDAHVGAKA
jgi:hypothetical protein